ncbi:DUF2254 domain-containing protein [Marinibacterium profundimaris]|uniref:DUF2254 domain-containing protein n=1 Tax=Marinibacterium profundimaris TaxID=1679460 RepID=A0A225NPI7_9RHOB|nr:DUF2254 domain-containing protein [Marinibacterium profundimaris]OWU74721.1 hypothetical protein ATO3_08855 [Marinibacterium profundimaris]
MLRTFLRVFAQLLRRLVSRVLIIASLALVALAAAVFIGPVVPDVVVEKLGVDSLDTILNILASSMLAVTTFSLSILTGAIQFASSSVTPRTRLVLRDDTLTNAVLSNFVGAFVFALLGIILRATPFMGRSESALLFLMTVLVVLIVIGSIMRWIDHLASLGSVDASLESFETIAHRVMSDFVSRPALGGHVMDRDEILSHSGKPALVAERAGYLEQIFEDYLQVEAEECGVDLYIPARPGDYLLPGMPLAWIDGNTPDKAAGDRLRSGFRITSNRLFEQDPRLAVIVLTEVASRALSPGINDPQTAVDVVHRLSAVLMDCAPKPGAEGQEDPAGDKDRIVNTRLYMAPTEPDVFFRTSLEIIARDGADRAEVREAIEAALDRLQTYGGPVVKEAARASRDRLVQGPAD